MQVSRAGRARVLLLLLGLPCGLGTGLAWGQVLPVAASAAGCETGTWPPPHVQALALAIALALLLPVATALLMHRRQSRLLAAHRALEARLREHTLALEEASLTDTLTGLRNRRFLLDRIDADCAAVLRRHGASLASGLPLADGDYLFFLMDLDRFKRLNDAHGHAAGDAVLRQLRERLERVFRSGDYMIRWGGEEFLIVARDTSRRHAAELAERLRALVADTPFLTTQGESLAVSCSVGFACFPLMPAQPAAFAWHEVVAAADAALYAAKRAGRNRWLGVAQAGGADAESLRGLLALPAEQWGSQPGLELQASAD